MEPDNCVRADKQREGGDVNLTDSDRETILTYAASDMNMQAAAKKMYLYYSTVPYRLDRIKQKTGLDPRRFYDLVKLVEIASADVPEDGT